eukprot:SAG22_NODE_168_length_16723_cov_6.542409_7_plen_230_part_00
MYKSPGAFYHPAKPDPPCLSCQANYYEATLRTIFCNKQLRPWFGGVYWWKWSSDPDPWSHRGEGAPYNHASGNNSDFYPQNKPAQAVLEKYYKHGCPAGWGGSADATATAAAAAALATPAVAVAVDVSGGGDAELPRFFQGTGFTPSAFLLTEQGRLNMLMARGGGYRLMRVHCMLDLIDIQGGPGQLRADYSRLDTAFDAIVHVSSKARYAAVLPRATSGRHATGEFG